MGGIIQNEFRIKFEKSDALTDLRKISQTMTKDEFIEFSYTAMKSAYDKNRSKAVEFMLGFHEKNSPQLLLRIHLQVMLGDDKKVVSGQKMLKVLAKHYSSDFCQEVINIFINCQPQAKRGACQLRAKEMLKVILETNLPEVNKNSAKRPKI